MTDEKPVTMVISPHDTESRNYRFFILDILEMEKKDLKAKEVLHTGLQFLAQKTYYQRENADLKAKVEALGAKLGEYARENYDLKAKISGETDKIEPNQDKIEQEGGDIRWI